jgi:Tfp pilus assembly protein PilF
VKRVLTAATLVLLTAGGCSSYSNTRKPSTQVRFGAHVAGRGYWREAMFRFQQAIHEDPNNARAHNDLAVAYEATGEFAKALDEYKKALQLAPGNSYIQRNYARFAEFYTSYTRTVGKALGGP